jgi:hypothetical protein
LDYSGPQGQLYAVWCLSDPGCYSAQREQAEVGGGASPITYTTQFRVLVAGYIALNTLQTNSGCAALFGVNNFGNQINGVPDPETVLSDILDGTGYASIAYLNIPQNDETIANAETSPVGPVSLSHTWGSAAITFNTNPSAPFNYQSLIVDAVTILHELGHVYEYLFGQSSTAILDDQDNVALSKANTALVQSKCFPGVSFSPP